MRRRVHSAVALREKRFQPLLLPDCIHMTEYCRCRILTVRECVGQTCSFRQSGSESRRSQDKLYQQLQALSSDRQKQIAVNYYNGEMPWKEEKRCIR